MNTRLNAINYFGRAYRHGRLFHVLSMAIGRSNRMKRLNIDAATNGITARHFAGLKSVPLSAIRGSEGRIDDFDAAFRPLHERTRQRWLSIAQAMLRGMELPPIELIQVGEHYYVRDGHHRVSVARAHGQQEIDAVVTIWHVAEPTRPVAQRLCVPTKQSLNQPC